eukprot:g19185.t1
MMMRVAAVAVAAASAATLVNQASAQDYETPLISRDGKEAAVYLGCFHDNKDDRVLGSRFHSADMTHEVCLDYCTDLGAAFMATQYGFECWCSSDGRLDYDRHDHITGEDAMCDMPCNGDESESEICGGFFSFNLYKFTTATPEPVTSLPGGAPADMQDLLDLHNEARCKHNAGPLTWSNEVAASAAVHAKFLSDTCIEDWDHSDRADRFNGAGENMYWCGGGGGNCYSAELAMDLWYVGQVKTNDVLKFGGHASQILWKATERLGCAKSVCTSGERPGTYLVCQYDPTGNVLGKYEDQLELPTNAGNC